MAGMGWPIGTNLAIFDQQVTLMLPTKFKVSWPFSSGEEAKNRFKRRQPSWIFVGNNLVSFDLQVTLMLPTKFQVNWSFSSAKKGKIDFQDGGQ